MADVKVVLKRKHTHADKEYPAGAELTLTETDAKWLVERQFAVMKKDVAAAVVSAPVTKAVTGAAPAEDSGRA